MGSFSDEINNEKQSSIVPDHDKSTQISDLEKMRNRIEGIREDSERAACEARLSNFEEHVELAERAYALGEAQYVDEHVKPIPELEPELVPDSRTYEQRVEDAKKDFAETERGLKLREMRDGRSDRLWHNLENFVDTYAPAPDTDRKTQEVSPDKERGPDRLGFDFSKATHH